MEKSGRKSRNHRLSVAQSGVWGTSSADFTHLVRRLYELSKQDAAATDGNCSSFVYCGIPMLFSSIRCLMIEYEFALPNQGVPEELMSSADIAEMLDYYKVSSTLREEIWELSEIRNEIIHPVHMPTGTADNWPDYLRSVKEKGLLQSTGRSDADYILLSQIASHRLFTWACRVTTDLAEVIIRSNPQKLLQFERFLYNWKSISTEQPFPFSF